jgi:hypothetical protein
MYLASRASEQQGMLILSNVPNSVDEAFWEYEVSEDIKKTFFRWPAEDGSNFVLVRISRDAFNQGTGQNLGIRNEEVRAALLNYRDLIQDLARAKYRPGDTAVTLDVGDFPAKDAWPGSA